MDLNCIKLSSKKLTDGVWWELERLADGTLGGRPMPGEPGETPALLIRPAGVEFERALENARRPHLIELREKRLSADVERAVLAHALAETVWAGSHRVTINGSELVWSKDVARNMLQDPQWGYLLDMILVCSRDRAAALAAEEEKAAGN